MSSSTLKQRLRLARTRAGYSMKEVAGWFGITAQAVSQWESVNSRAQPSRDKISELATRFSVPADWLLTGMGDALERTSERHAASEPRDSATIQAGLGLLPVYACIETADGKTTMGQSPIDWVERPHNLRNVRGAFAVYIVDVSMEPRLYRGDMVMVNPHRPAKPRSTVLVRLRGGSDSGERVVVAELMGQSSERLALRQLNPRLEYEVPRADAISVSLIVGAAYQE